MNTDIAIPKEWATVQVPKIDAKLYDGARIQIPAYNIDVATRYPRDIDGNLIANLKHREVAQFLRDYNKEHDTNFKFIPLYADEAIRDQLGKEHTMFDENFGRNNMPWIWGHFADFTRPSNLGIVEGVNKKQLVTRELWYRLPGGDERIGLVTIAPTGIVPKLTREQIEKRIDKEGLTILEKLRGREIYERGDEIVDVRDALGYPQFTLQHDARDENGLLPHSHHIYTPDQSTGEVVGSRYVLWHVNEQRCFDVNLNIAPEDSTTTWSFPLVRGE